MKKTEKDKAITTKKFDQLFDQGKNISKYLDQKKIRKVNNVTKRVNIDFPLWIVEELDIEANRLGVTRQSLVKIWIAERFQKKAA